MLALKKNVILLFLKVLCLILVHSQIKLKCLFRVWNWCFIEILWNNFDKVEYEPKTDAF